MASDLGDIRVGVAFDVLNVVSGMASGVFSRDASVFVSSRVLHYARAYPHLDSNPLKGLQSSTREGKP